MEKLGRLPSERFVEKNVFWSGAKPFISSDDMCDFHEMVIDDIREMVGGKSIRFKKDLIIDIGPWVGDLSFDGIGEYTLSREWDFKTDYIGKSDSEFILPESTNQYQ